MYVDESLYSFFIVNEEEKESSLLQYRHFTHTGLLCDQWQLSMSCYMLITCIVVSLFVLFIFRV
jgi:hypothetical protein